MADWLVQSLRSGTTEVLGARVPTLSQKRLVIRGLISDADLDDLSIVIVVEFFTRPQPSKSWRRWCHWQWTGPSPKVDRGDVILPELARQPQMAVDAPNSGEYTRLVVTISKPFAVGVALELT